MLALLATHPRPLPSREGSKTRPPFGQPAAGFGALAAFAVPAAATGFEVGIWAAQSALTEQHRNLGSGVREPDLTRSDQHVREARR